MKKRFFFILFILLLIAGCGSTKKLQREIDIVKQEGKTTDSTLIDLDNRIREFSEEVKAMRDTYNEDHKTLEDLYRLNAESKRSVSELKTDLNTEFERERVRTDSIVSLAAAENQEKYAAIDSSLQEFLNALNEMQNALKTTEFQVDSIYAMVEPTKLTELEDHLLQLQSYYGHIDSAIADYQLAMNDQMMQPSKSIKTLERHARVQDSTNFDILSQLVLLENKIISLTNSFNELMALPGSGQVAGLQEMPATVSQPTTSQHMDYDTYKQHYIDALSSYQNRDFMAAIDQFQMLIRNDSQNDLADNAQYWIGESYYALDDYANAIGEFRKVLQFPDSNKADAAQFKIGYCYLNVGDKARGYEELQRLLDMFPDSSYRTKVAQILSSK